MRYFYLDGPTLQLRDEPRLTLDQMHALVGGYIEQVWSTAQITAHPPGEPTLVVIDNEDGLRLNLPPSVRFPRVYSVGGVIRGPVVIMGLDADGDQCDLTDAQLARVTIVTNAGDPYPTLHVRE